MKNLLLYFFFLSAFTLAAQDCKIGELVVKKGDCDREGNFYVTINFRHEGTSECFTLKGLNKDYGTFKYSQLPIKIGPLKGDCKTNYGFAVIDCERESCRAKVILGKVCCGSTAGCSLTDLSVTRSDCDSLKRFYFKIDFKYANTFDCFNLTINGKALGSYKYADLPIKVGAFEGDCKTNYVIKVTDCKSERCTLTKEFGKVCCDQSTCEIGQIAYEKTACASDGTFYVSMKFDHRGTSNCFTVKGNGRDFGTFKYASLPIKIGPLKGDCITNYGFAIVDCENLRCGREVNVGVVCCNVNTNCELGELQVAKTDCKEGKFSVKINFKYANTSDCFRLKGNGHDYGTFKYADLPITIDGLAGDCKTEYEFVAIDCHNERCQRTFVLGKVCCTTTTNCEIGELQVAKTDCKEGKFGVKISFKYANTSDCFRLKGNGHDYGTFKYADLPIFIDGLVGDCKTEYEFVVIDCHNERCQRTFVLGKVCCTTTTNCELGELQVAKTDCKEGKFGVKINFKYANTSDCFRLKGNGHDYGTFKYADLPIFIDGLVGDCKTEYEFVVIDCHNERCQREYVLGKVCCGAITDCKITSKIEKTACDSNDVFYIHVLSTQINGSGCLRIFVNGRSFGEYKAGTKITVGPLVGDCKTSYELKIVDCENEKCFEAHAIGVVCCDTKPCLISSMEIGKTACVEGKFDVKIFANYSGTSSCFVLTGNGKNYGTFKYADLPITLKGLAGDCKTNYEFVMTDCEDKHCSIAKSIGVVCCTTQTNCKINLKVERTFCDADDNFYALLIVNQIEGSKCVRVYVNGTSLGEFTLNNPLIPVGPFKGDCRNYEFKVVDCKDEHCFASFDMGKVCCGQNTACEIGEIKWSKSDCNDRNNFSIKLDFKYTGTSDCFRLKGNGHDYGTFNYANLPITIDGLAGDCKTEYEFVIVDCKNEKCTRSIQVGKVCCGQNTDCGTRIEKLERTDCDTNGLFYAHLIVKQTNGSGCVKIFVNGVLQGEFALMNPPIQIGPFKADCMTEYNFRVVDCKNEKCVAESSLCQVCCDGTKPCDIGAIKYDVVPCDSNKQAFVVINFESEHVGECFVVSINGKDFSKFKYGNGPYMIGPLLADCVTEYVISVRDCNTACCKSEVYIGKLCCRNVIGCKLSELKVSPLECTGAGQYSLKLDFDYVGVTGVGFDVFDRTGNIGFYKYSDLPLTIKNFKKTSARQDFIKICENDNPNCCVVAEFVGLNCLKNTNDKFQFSLEEVDAFLAEEDIIILKSEHGFPETFSFELYHVMGHTVGYTELSRSAHQIVLQTRQRQTGLVVLQTKYDLKKSFHKFIFN